jgi:hypothetical protein
MSYMTADASCKAAAVAVAAVSVGAHQICAWVRARLHAAAERAKPSHIVWVGEALVDASILLTSAVLVLAVPIACFLCIADERG